MHRFVHRVLHPRHSTGDRRSSLGLPKRFYFWIQRQRRSVGRRRARVHRSDWTLSQCILVRRVPDQLVCGTNPHDCVELRRLSDVLQSINAMRVQGQHNILAFARVDQDLWKQSGLAFSDCEKTLQELTAFVDRIRMSTGSRMFLRRLRLATDLRLQTKDLVLIQEKLRASNSSFQTLLQVLNV